MTPAAVLAIAMQCLSPQLAPIASGIAMHESNGNPNAINHNANGTYDRGLAQINDVNLKWLGLTPITVMDPCNNLRAAIKVLFVRYNGNPPDAVKVAYAAGVMSKIPDIALPAPLPPCAPAWDAWALALCSPTSSTKGN